MFRLHCNKCGVLQTTEPKRSFTISRCHHVVCAVCLAAQKALCPVCQRPFQGTEINRSLPTHVANYFQDPRPFLELWKKISQFQTEQVASDNLHFWHRQQRAKAVKRDLEGLTKLSTELSNKNEREKQKITKIREYITQFERALEAKKDIPSELLNTSHDLCCNTPSSRSTNNTLSDANLQNLMNITLSSNGLESTRQLKPQCPGSAPDIKNATCSDSLGSNGQPKSKRPRSVAAIQNGSFLHK